MLYNPSTAGIRGASSLLSNIDRYVIIRKLLDSVLNIVPVFIHWREFQIYNLHRLMSGLVDKMDVAAIK
jgi:hypothetical protein